VRVADKNSSIVMAQANGAKSGSFKVGGDIKVNRLGFGAMRITGAGIWGPPADREEALRTLKRLPDLSIDFVDTADSYGPDVSELLIHEALHPYKGMLIATKAGFRRSGPGKWEMDGARSICASRRSRAASNWASSRSGSGSFTASTPRCRARSNSPPSDRCSMTASSAIRA
jgi:hypothetical protein